MRLNKNQRIILLLALGVVFITLGYFWYCHTEKGYAPLYPNNIVSQSTEISKNELAAFLKTWPEYKQAGLDKVGLSQYAQSDAEMASPKTSRWLRRKGWDVKRFYYIEQRVRAIISTIKKDDFILKNNQMIMAQAQGSGNSDVTGALLKLAQSEYKKLNIEKITPQERAMVTPQIDEIINVLQGSQPN